MILKKKQSDSIKHDMILLHRREWHEQIVLSRAMDNFNSQRVWKGLHKQRLSGHKKNILKNKGGGREIPLALKCPWEGAVSHPWIIISQLIVFYPYISLKLNHCYH